MANIYAYGSEGSNSEGFVKVGKWEIDFDSFDFTSDAASSKGIYYTSGDVVRLLPAVPTGQVMLIFAASVAVNTASTAATTAVLDVGKDGGTELFSDVDVKTAAISNSLLAAPIALVAGEYLTCDNVITGAGTKGKVTISVIYTIV